MKSFDKTKSVWYERYKPSCVDDLVIPESIKSKLLGYVQTQDIPNIGLFSSNPGCLLPGTNITVDKEPDWVSYSDIKKDLELSKSEMVKLKRYVTYTNGSFDRNFITPKIIDIVKLTGVNAHKFAGVYKEDCKYNDKHLKVMHWVYKLDDIMAACDEVKRVRHFKDFFDIDLHDDRFKNFKEERKLESILSIKFDVIHSSAKNIKDLYINFDKPTTIDFWTIRGWSKEEAVEKISSIQRNNLTKREEKYTGEELKIQRGYGQSIQKFLDLGYSLIESKKLLKCRQTTFSLDKCIEKYGKDEGTKIWKERQIKWQNTLKSKTQEEIDNINNLKSSGYNNFKYPIGIPGKLYYIRFYDETTEFFKIGITKKELNERFKFNKINLSYDIIFEQEFDDIYDAYILEQKILSKYNDQRIKINRDDFKTTEAFNVDVLKEFYEI